MTSFYLKHELFKRNMKVKDEFGNVLYNVVHKSAALFGSGYEIWDNSGVMIGTVTRSAAGINSLMNFSVFMFGMGSITQGRRFFNHDIVLNFNGWQFQNMNLTKYILLDYGGTAIMSVNPDFERRRGLVMNFYDETYISAGVVIAAARDLIVRGYNNM